MKRISYVSLATLLAAMLGSAAALAQTNPPPRAPSPEQRDAATLEVLISEAWTNNPEVRLYEAAVAGARGELVTAKTWNNPEVSLAPGAVRTEESARLDEMGIPAKSVATESGIPYETIILWRYNRRHKSETGAFHEVTVARSNSVPAVRAAKRLAAPKSDGKSRISKSGTVTATDYEMASTSLATGAGLKMTTPNGYVIEGLDARALAWLLAAFSQGDGHAL